MDGESAERRRRIALPLWFVGAAVLLLGWRVFEPLGRDQSIFYVLARELWHGALPYRDVFEHKPPGVILVYAVAYVFDGGAGWAIAVLDTLAAGVTAWLLCRALSLGGEARAGLWAGAVYLVTARAPVFGGFWFTGQPEAFQDLFVAAALVLALRERWRGAGAALAAVLLLKFTYVLLLPAFFVWAGRKHAARFFVGVAAPVAVLALVAAALGAFGPAWQAIIVFNMRHASVDAIPWFAMPGVFFARLVPLLLWTAGVWLPGLVGLVFSLRMRKPEGGPRWIVIALFVAALVQLVIQRKLWNWHWAPLMPALALGAGLAWSRLAVRARVVAYTLAVLLLAPSLLLTTRDIARCFTANGPEEKLARYTWGRGDFSALEVASVGNAVAKLAKPEDRLLVWGFEPGVYLASGLRPATRWLYDYPLTVGLSPADRAVGIADVVEALPRTRWWLVFDHDSNALEPSDSRTELAAVPVLRDALARDYRPVGKLFDAELFERRSDAAGPLHP